MRAQFSMVQPPVRHLEWENKLYIFIALNGSHAEDSDVWEYDYWEIITTSDKIDVKDVEANPEKYMGWTEPGLVQKIEEAYTNSRLALEKLGVSV